MSLGAAPLRLLGKQSRRRELRRGLFDETLIICAKYKAISDGARLAKNGRPFLFLSSSEALGTASSVFSTIYRQSIRGRGIFGPDKDVQLKEYRSAALERVDKYLCA